jgi:transmembrane sensor
MDYTIYTTEDFVTDEYFIQWVKNPTAENSAFWNAWLSKNPEKEAIIKEARQIILMLHFREVKAPQGKFLEIWGNIVEAEDRPILEIAPHRDNTAHRIGWWYKVAAAVLVVATALTYTLLSRKDTVTIQTAYGESRTLFLPDSTKVTLNANSILRYAADFNKDTREVWLDGEAFFAVVHKENNQNFLVHTEELQVEVLGTRFNVNTRGGKSQVVLEEGKVKLAIHDSKESNAPMVMQPGDLVEVSRTTKQVMRKKVEAEYYSSWRQNKLVFVGTSLEEIARLLKDNYDYDVRFKNEDVAKLLFTGSAPVDDPQELLQILSKVFGLAVRQEGRSVIIERK